MWFVHQRVRSRSIALVAVATCAAGVGTAAAAPDAERRAPDLQPKVTSDAKPSSVITPAHGRKISWNKILNAIYLEGNEWAALYESSRGTDNWFEIADGSCYWIRFGKSGGCSGFIVEYTPEACAFAGKPGYSRSYQTVDVIARKIPGRRAASGKLIETYGYFYCYS